MSHRSHILLLISVIGSSAATAIAQPKPMPDPLEQNAALAYWQAFAVTPQLSEAETKLRDQVLEGTHPIDADARKIVKQSKDALNYLHRGAKLDRAVWGVAWDEGPFALMPHLSKARELVRLAAFRARVRFEDGEHEQAIDDLLAAMTLGRHLAKEGVIVFIPLLVDYAIESICIQELAAHLPKLDAQARTELKRRIEGLPASQSLTKAMQGEKDVFLPWLIAEVKKPNAKRRILDLVGKVSEEEIQAFQQLDDSELLPATQRMGGYFDRMIAMVKLSPQDLKDKDAKLMQEIKQNGAQDLLSRWLLPAAEAGKRAEARQLTRLAMFQAGLAVLEDGPKALNEPQHADPFGDGPFAYSKTDAGFVLTSDWDLGNDKKLSLTFGK